MLQLVAVLELRAEHRRLGREAEIDDGGGVQPAADDKRGAHQKSFIWPAGEGGTKREQSSSGGRRPPP